jgi:hypothetical protein
LFSTWTMLMSIFGKIFFFARKDSFHDDFRKTSLLPDSFRAFWPNSTKKFGKFHRNLNWCQKCLFNREKMYFSSTLKSSII